MMDMIGSHIGDIMNVGNDHIPGITVDEIRGEMPTAYQAAYLGSGMQMTISDVPRSQSL